MIDEPEAWGVIRVVGGGWVSILANKVQAETSRTSWDEMENWVHKVVPLYRHPQPTLTDEERECLEWAEELAGNCEEFGRVDTLRGLLERLK